MSFSLGVSGRYYEHKVKTFVPTNAINVNGLEDVPVSVGILLLETKFITLLLLFRFHSLCPAPVRPQLAH